VDVHRFSRQPLAGRVTVTIRRPDLLIWPYGLPGTSESEAHRTENPPSPRHCLFWWAADGIGTRRRAGGDAGVQRLATAPNFPVYDLQKVATAADSAMTYCPPPASDNAAVRRSFSRSADTVPAVH